LATRAQFRHEDIAAVPRGWRVRTVTRGDHEVRLAFPPGRPKKGAGKLISILHPKGERNPNCFFSEKAKSNPSELLIFGNPDRAAQRAARERAASIRHAAGRNGKPRGHKIGCKCIICQKRRNPAPGKKHDIYGRKFRGATRGEAVKRALRYRELKGRRAAKKTFGNPEDLEAAVNLYETFHGKDASEIVEKHESAAMREDYTALGKLIALGLGEPRHRGNGLVNNWEKEDHLGFEGDGVTLASSPDGKQLYLIGGNQNLASCLHRFDVDKDKDFIDLGEIGFVVYEARKIHAGYEPVEYVHQFGEESGALPVGMYNKLQKRIYLVGGEYFIDLTQAVSPGIEN
jgi:hypothetical protein